MNSKTSSVLPVVRALLLGAMFLLAGDAARATDGAWNANASTTWSSSGNWVGSIIADGVGSTAWFTNNITAGRSATIDGAVSSRTNGILNLGDADGGSAFTIAANGGASLYLDNGGANAQINERLSSRGDILSAPIVLLGSLDINNASTNLFVNTLTFSGAISAGTAGTKTISSVGTGYATNAISGIISDGAGVVAVVQNNAAGTLRLSGASTFTGGLTINAGTVSLLTSPLAGGGSGLGTIYLGDTSGSANATLLGDGRTYTNTIVVRAGSSGVLTMGNSLSGATVFRGPVTLNTNLVLVGGGSGSINLSSNVTGIGGISTFGPGTVTLSGSNSFSGGVTVNGGTLTLGNAAALGTGAFTLASNATLSGASTVTLTTTNQQAWNADFTVGNFTLNMAQGTVALGTNVTVTGSGASSVFVVPGSVTGAWGIVKAGAGTTMRLSGSNSYSGGTTIDGGVLVAQNNHALGTGPVTVNGGVLAFSLASGNITNLSSTISGAGTVQILNTALLFTMLSSNAYTGGTLIQGNNRVFLGDDSALGTGTITIAPANNGTPTLSSIGSASRTIANNLVFSNCNNYFLGNLTDNGTLAFNGTANLSGSQAVWTVASPVIFSGVVSNGGITKLGGGTLVLSNAGNAFALGVSNSGGMVALGVDHALGSGTVVMNGGGLQSADGGARTITNALVFAGNGVFGAPGTGDLAINSPAVDLGTGTRILAVSNNLTTLANAVTNTGGLTKAGPGTLVLNGNNSWRGATFVSNGTMVLNGDNSQVTGTFTAGAGATLTNAGTYSPSTLTLGSVAGSPATLVLANGSTFSVGGATVGSVAGGQGVVRLSGGAFLQTNGNFYIGSAGATGTVTVTEGTFSAVTLYVGGNNTAAAALGTLEFLGGTNHIGNMSVGKGGAGSLLVGGNNPLVLLTNAGSLAIGDYAGSPYQGQAIVSNGTVMAGLVNVANRAPSTGILSIYGGSVIAMGGGLDLKIAYQAGSTGTVLLAGPTALLVSTQRLTGGSFTLAGGDNTLGEVIISQGKLLSSGMSLGGGVNSLATMTIGDGSLILPSNYSTIGTVAGATARVLLNDPNALLVSSNGTLTVGSGGSGSLTVSNGFVLLSNGQNLLVGDSAGSQGAISMFGGRLAVGGSLTVGNLGTGSFFMASGTLLEVGGSLTVGAESANSFTNQGGILQFLTGAPTVTNRGGALAVVDGTVSFRGVGNAAVLGQITNIAYSGANALRLDASTNASAASYAIGAGSPFARLEMINGGTLWQGGALTLGAAGSMLVSNSAAVVSAGFTNLGSVRVVNGSLNFSQPITVSESASITLVHATNSFDGGMVVASNAFYGGSGRVESGPGATSFGTISPGNSPGTLAFSSNLTLLESSLLVLEIGGTNSADYDHLLVEGLLTKGGSVLVTNLGYAFLGGETFDFVDAAALAGSFAALSLPTLTGGMSWDTSLFESQGVLGVIAIPEPSAALALAAGLAALALARRRKA
jgi:autotransporter-associated beta strand protein/T5SS/PEP-CTERM-associated repeat protein